MKIQRVLAIETSCDDTSVSIISDGGWVEALVSAHQNLRHQPFGGIVPEVASRSHTETLMPLIEQVVSKRQGGWDSIDGLVVTSRPGLIGSLLVGVVTAKALALSYKIPLLGVNHLEGHLLAPFLRDSEFQPPKKFQTPYVALAVSGGHTQLYHVEEQGVYSVLGKTLDDAAGEAFDKFAKLLGLGFPGGEKVDHLAKTGDPTSFAFPRALMGDPRLDFSFSGLKTAGQNQLRKMKDDEIKNQMSDLCASFQQAIVDALLKKLDLAISKTGLERAILTGGVSANSGLRTQAQQWAKEKGVQLVIPPIRYCTDNAAMIGYAGLLRMQKGEVSAQNLSAQARSLDSDFQVGISR